MYTPPPIPAKSEIMFPIAAAHNVLIPKATPKLVSIASPAMIKIALSIKPNPRNGKPVVKATRRNI